MALIDFTEAARQVAAGGVIAYPTEAVFGLGCNPLSRSAVNKILELKGRSATKGLIVIALNAADVDPWVQWDAVDRRSIVQSWPGPVTWLLPATDQAPAGVAAGGALAVRVPVMASLRELLQACGTPLVSTSANPQGQPPARRAEDLMHWLGDGFPVVTGSTGGRDNPTEIRDARRGNIVRNG